MIITWKISFVWWRIKFNSLVLSIESRMSTSRSSSALREMRKRIRVKQLLGHFLVFPPSFGGSCCCCMCNRIGGFLGGFPFLNRVGLVSIYLTNSLFPSKCNCIFPTLMFLTAGGQSVVISPAQWWKSCIRLDRMLAKERKIPFRMRMKP